MGRMFAYVAHNQEINFFVHFLTVTTAEKMPIQMHHKNHVSKGKTYL